MIGLYKNSSNSLLVDSPSKMQTCYPVLIHFSGTVLSDPSRIVPLLKVSSICRLHTLTLLIRWLSYLSLCINLLVTIRVLLSDYYAISVVPWIMMLISIIIYPYLSLLFLMQIGQFHFHSCLSSLPRSQYLLETMNCGLLVYRGWISLCCSYCSWTHLDMLYSQ